MTGISTLLSALARALRAGAKLVALRPVARADIPPSPELFAALIMLDLALMLGFNVAAFGINGSFNPYEIPRSLLFVPLVLGLGLIVHKIERSTDLLVLPVAYAAASVIMTVITSVLYILAQHQLIPFVERYWTTFDYVVLAWSAAIVLLAAWRLLGGSAAGRGAAGVAAIALVVMPQFLTPQGMLWTPPADERAREATSGFYTLAQEGAFYAQQGALERELERLRPERPSIADMYVIAAGLYAGEDVFMKEVQMIAELMRQRFDADGRTVTLINNVHTLQTHPLA
ncbi:MAG: hypothetical protein V4637_05775, partial [Pseudomonadota bacterium]